MSPKLFAIGHKLSHCVFFFLIIQFYSLSNFLNDWYTFNKNLGYLLSGFLLFKLIIFLILIKQAGPLKALSFDHYLTQI